MKRSKLEVTLKLLFLTVKGLSIVLLVILGLYGFIYVFIEYGPLGVLLILLLILGFIYIRPYIVRILRLKE